MKRPMVVAYILSGVTHRIYRLLGLSKLSHVALPNLLAGRELFPEFLQRRVRADLMGPALEAQLAASKDRAAWYDAVKAIHEQLRQGASKAAAAAVIDLLAGRKRL